MNIDIEKDDIPYEFDMELSEEIFTFTLNYNERYDFFTIDLYKDSEPIVIGEKIVYGKPLFSTFTDSRLPSEVIIAINENGDFVEKITWENFGDTVVLMVGDLIE